MRAKPRKNLLAALAPFLSLAFAALPLRAEEIATASRVQSVTNVISGFAPITATSELTTMFKIQWHSTCFGTNNRFVKNPLSVNADIQMRVKFKGYDTVYVITCPATITNPVLDEITAAPLPPGTCSVSKGTVDADNNYTATASLDPAKSRAHLVTAVFPIPEMATVSVGADGTYNAEKKSISTIDYIQFVQRLPAIASDLPDAYPALDNVELTSSTRYSMSPKRSVLQIWSSFPGKGGNTSLYDWTISGKTGLPPGNYCGGYYSPLMLFFDAKRPRFSGTSGFPLAPGKKIYWPEAGAPGHFLARVDRKGETAISRADQLFGQGDGFQNGFDSLKRLDSDGNGLIDAKDAEFERLVLWQDRNSDGQSTPEEVQSLQKAGVLSINLKYHDPGMLKFGGRALVQGVSDFTFAKAKGAKRIKGDVLDVWFNVTPESLVQK
ncbi:MAG: hypothetical protein NDJ89_06985 [Oligoflexia bacterium]|nr:hypothetical protein [Oligoflexia bacterium]